MAGLALIVSIGAAVPAGAGHKLLAPKSKCKGQTKTIGGKKSQRKAKRAVRCLVNHARKKQGRGKLKAHKHLNWAGRKKTQDMAQCEFSHEACGRDTFHWPQQRYGQAFYAENIAAGQRSARAVMDSWLNSTGHRGNLLSKTYKQIGIDVRKSGGTTYWVQIFGKR